MGRVCQWGGCASGEGVPVGRVCQWEECASGEGVPVGGVCQWECASGECDRGRSVSGCGHSV